MDYLKTKEAAAALGVSPTTIKRWASRMPGQFRKDASGHYVFQPDDLPRLSALKGAADCEGSGPDASPSLPSPLDKVEGPVLVPADPSTGNTHRAVRMGKPVSPSWDRPAYPPGWEELKDRLMELERSLDRKAGDIVTYQILEHRRELDELRQSVRELACSLDALTHSLREPTDRRLTATEDRPVVRRKSWIGSLL
ncbi:MerR family transcriptional regulator [Gorillibacterium sp. CAU 1737]|uniref:MerR family transcriptional regulator n=1 Tax=Gorillibacterium sp. CAU 1737 TaxID=3140362 RepID=UPI00326052B1